MTFIIMNLPKSLFHKTLVLTGALLLCSNAFCQTKANYRLAERFRKLEAAPIYKLSTRVSPTFINETDCFYYNFTTSEGTRYYYVNPSKREHRLLFDNKELLSKVASYTRRSYNDKEPGLYFSFLKDNKTIEFSMDSYDFHYNIFTKELKTVEKQKDDSYEVEPYWMNYSPDSLYFLYAKKHNLYMVGNEKKGQDTTEVQLTFDGAEDYTFNREDEGKLEGRFGAQGTKWIPNSHYFYAVREDNRKVDYQYLINNLTPKPELVKYRAELAGDKNVSQYEILIGNVDTKEVKKIDTYRWPDQYIDVLYVSKDGKRLYFQRYNRPWNQADICEVNVETGDVRVVIHEENKPYLDYQMRCVEFLNDGKEILFRSERTGWGHYYLYDSATGELKNTVTEGGWVAGPVFAKDEKRREIYFYGYGKEKGVDPYYYILYRVNVDKGMSSLRKLTAENASHDVSFSPTHNFYVDSYSTVEMPTKNVVRNRKGKVIMKLEDPDLQKVYDMGWRMPERFTVKAADGFTDLYGVMWKPADFDSTKTYPIISNVYPGPHFEYVPSRFTINDSKNTRLAQLGFIVITVGHRGGTPMRGKEYHTYGYGNQRDYALADDKAAIEQLAKRYKFIDINKVGIYGHSGGGFMSAAAIMTYPDFYKAAVSSAGNHDNSVYNKGWVEIHFGVNEYKKEVKDSDGKTHTEYSYSVSTKPNQELAKNYKSGLLLFTGLMDDTVNPAHTFRLADALIQAGKDFEMITLPECTHGFSGKSDLFFEHKMWRHFAKRLLGDESAMDIIDLNHFMEK